MPQDFGLDSDSFAVLASEQRSDEGGQLSPASSYVFLLLARINGKRCLFSGGPLVSFPPSPSAGCLADVSSAVVLGS